MRHPFYSDARWPFGLDDLYPQPRPRRRVPVRRSPAPVPVYGRRPEPKPQVRRIPVQWRPEPIAKPEPIAEPQPTAKPEPMETSAPSEEAAPESVTTARSSEDRASQASIQDRASQSSAPESVDVPESVAPSETAAPAPMPIALDPLAATKARIKREAKRDTEQQRRAILVDMLSVFDDLDRAVQAARDAGEDEGPLWDGICLVRDSFIRKLDKHGAQLIDSDERSFDPALHEAVAVQSVEQARAGQIIRTLQRGFTVGDELLRPARVIVGKAA